MGSLEIYTLGGLLIKQDGEPLSRFPTRKAEALLVYVACDPRPHSRELLAELFWEGRSQGQSLANLRPILASLRDQLGTYLTITRQAVALNPTTAWTLDVASLEQKLLTADQQRLLTGDLTP